MTEKFEFIDAEYAIYMESGEKYVPSIVKMCIWMEVSRSGFYGWRDKPESATAKRRGILAICIHIVHRNPRGRRTRLTLGTAPGQRRLTP